LTKAGVLTLRISYVVKVCYPTAGERNTLCSELAERNAPGQRLSLGSFNGLFVVWDNHECATVDRTQRRDGPTLWGQELHENLQHAAEQKVRVGGS